MAFLLPNIPWKPFLDSFTYTKVQWILCFWHFKVMHLRLCPYLTLLSMRSSPKSASIWIKWRFLIFIYFFKRKKKLKWPSLKGRKWKSLGRNYHKQGRAVFFSSVYISPHYLADIHAALCLFTMLKATSPYRHLAIREWHLEPFFSQTLRRLPGLPLPSASHPQESTAKCWVGRARRTRHVQRSRQIKQ